MELRQAILAAADWIEKYPQTYVYKLTRVPPKGGCGCMLGHTGVFLGIDAGESISKVEEMLGINPNDLSGPYYLRMADLMGSHPEHWNWRMAVDGLRAYANHYYPAEPSKPTGSEICLAIMARPFDEKESAHV